MALATTVSSVMLHCMLRVGLSQKFTQQNIVLPRITLRRSFNPVWLSFPHDRTIHQQKYSHMTFTNVLESKFVICLESSKVGSGTSCAYQCVQVEGNRGNQIESNCSAIQYHLSKKKASPHFKCEIAVIVLLVAHMIFVFRSIRITASPITMPNTCPCTMAVVFTLQSKAINENDQCV